MTDVPLKYLERFGAYYADDSDHGFSLCFEKGDFKISIEDYWKRHQKAVSSVLDAVKTNELTISGIWYMLHSTIKEYNIAVWGSEKRVMYKDADIPVFELHKEIITIFVCIAALQVLKELEANDYNGIFLQFEIPSKEMH
jgi:hypothetical protein